MSLLSEESGHGRRAYELEERVVELEDRLAVATERERVRALETIRLREDLEACRAQLRDARAQLASPDAAVVELQEALKAQVDRRLELRRQRDRARAQRDAARRRLERQADVAVADLLRTRLGQHPRLGRLVRGLRRAVRR